MRRLIWLSGGGALICGAVWLTADRLRPDPLPVSEILPKISPDDLRVYVERLEAIPLPSVAESDADDRARRTKEIEALARLLFSADQDGQSSEEMLKMVQLLKRDGVASACAYLENEKTRMLTNAFQSETKSAAEMNRIAIPIFILARLQALQGFKIKARETFRQGLDLCPSREDLLMIYQGFLMLEAFNSFSGNRKIALEMAEEAVFVARRLPIISNRSSLSESLYLLGLFQSFDPEQGHNSISTLRESLTYAEKLLWSNPSRRPEAE